MLAITNFITNPYTNLILEKFMQINGVNPIMSQIFVELVTKLNFA